MIDETLTSPTAFAMVLFSGDAKETSFRRLEVDSGSGASAAGSIERRRLDEDLGCVWGTDLG